MPKTVADKSGGGPVDRPKSEVLTKDKRRTLRMMVQEKNNAVSTVIVGIIVVILIFIIGGGLIILAGVYNKTDLYIVGVIFLVGGLMFGVIFIITNCKPFLLNRKIHAQLDKDAEELDKERPTTLVPGENYVGEYDTKSNANFYRD